MQKLLHIQKTNTIAKTCAYTKNKYENKKFLRYPFAYLWNKMWNYFSYFNHNFYKCKHNLHSNEHNVIVFSRVFCKYFCGIPGTENTPARVQKCFWNDKNTKKWVSGHNTQCQNTQMQNNQCHNNQCDI